uniref:Uncharacterized protein n=1 Tax=Arundo donax TaxID=35708 RepID=A0A0A9CFU6_ARUDO
MLSSSKCLVRLPVSMSAKIGCYAAANNLFLKNSIPGSHLLIYSYQMYIKKS